MKGKKHIMDCLKVINDFKKNIPERNIDNAVKLAKDLIEALEYQNYPIPIVKTLNDLGFSVFASEMPAGISGFMLISADLKESFDSDKIIAIDQKDKIARQRFTLAHEFGHYLFDYKEKNQRFISTYNIDAAETEEEKIPSRFAAEFLMPSEIFKKRYKELSSLTPYERFNQLMEDFNATLKSVELRFEELELE